jgi:hypothetical protein
MAYNFLELVNDVNRRLNEVPLTSSTFASATGYQADVKSYVNTAINRINREEFEWPFNHVTIDQLLVVDQSKYSLPLDLKSAAFDTFRVKGEAVLSVDSKRLSAMDYEEYRHKYPDHEFRPELYHDAPEYVSRTRDLAFVISPPPDKAYTVRYEYYRFPLDLETFDAVPTIPPQFKWVILEGALYSAYMFRGGIEEATISTQLFQSGLKDMRKIYINRTEYARSTVIRS